MAKLPDNINRLVNYYSMNAFCWGEWQDEKRIKNVCLADAANGFVINGKPDYASQLSWAAHNAVEWDTNIHADVRKRILRLAAAGATTDQGSPAGNRQSPPGDQ